MGVDRQSIDLNCPPLSVQGPNYQQEPNALGLHHLPDSTRTEPMTGGGSNTLQSSPYSPEDFYEEPPALPSHLQLTLLNVPPFEENMGSSPRPQHLNPNHIYVDMGENFPSVLALSSTHQYRAKYVTIALYKPVHK
jgi:hypothetical protein